MMSAHEDTASDGKPWTSPMGALGGFIREQRRLADLSLREMSAMTQVSNAYLSQVERGLHQPSLKVLRAISEALNINAQELLGQAGFGVPTDTEETRTAPGRDPIDTEASIMADPRLNLPQRRAVLGVYRSFVDENAPSPGDRAGSP